MTIVVKDTAGASTGLTPTVQLYGEAQDGTVYTGNPTNTGDRWTFVVPGPGTYTAEVSAPGYKTAQRLLAISSETDNPQYDVTLEPDNHARKVKGKSIMAPKTLAELEKGKKALGEKKFDEAKVHLDKVLRLAPSSPDANYYSGLLNYYTGNRKAALEHLQKSVSMDHNNGPAYLALGEIYYLEKDYPHATNVLEQGLALEPDSWRAKRCSARPISSKRITSGDGSTRKRPLQLARTKPAARVSCSENAWQRLAGRPRRSPLSRRFLRSSPPRT